MNILPSFDVTTYPDTFNSNDVVYVIITLTRLVLTASFTMNEKGSQRFQLHVIEISGRGWQQPLLVVDDIFNMEWAADSATILYTRLDSKLRPAQLFAQTLVLHSRSAHVPEVANPEILIFHELHDDCLLDISKTKDGSYLCINSNNKNCSEVHVLPAGQPFAVPRLVEPRGNFSYFVEHRGDRFYIITNADDAINFKIVQAPDQNPNKANWQDVVPHNSAAAIEDADFFADQFVVYYRIASQPQMHCFPYLMERSATSALPGCHLLNTWLPQVLQLPWSFNGEAISFIPEANPDFNAHNLMYSTSSPVRSTCLQSWNLQINTSEVLAASLVDFSATHTSYLSFASALDGARIPMTVTHVRNLVFAGCTKVLLLGYGSYGVNCNTSFKEMFVPLLQRGWAIVHCHVRGGNEGGAAWYNAARGLSKEITFSDLTCCIERLFELNLTSPQLVFGYGVSAGGLLFAAAGNRHPSWFGGLILKVPFVDVVSSMCDANLALTAQERTEWGDPLTCPAELEAILRYSPYQNITAQEYPPLLITASLFDEHVPCWQVAKYVARLRRHNTVAQP